MSTQTIFDFNKDSNIRKWVIVNDNVMGGRSTSSFSLNEDGNGVFEGDVSLENNGGFSSVRYNCKKININDFTKIRLKIKGDGKNYQVRIKPTSDTYYSYITTFSTTGEWEEIEVSLSEMYPSFRGRKLNQPNFNAASIEEITFLIGNKKKEHFQLLIDKIDLL